MNGINWEKLLQVDDEWVDRLLVTHEINQDVKLKVRGHSLKFSGNLSDCNELANFLGKSISTYVHGALGDQDPVEKWREAQKYFGKKNPDTDGKYGELLLFVLVESILKCPMVSHKIRALTNSKDQVKGSDGVFLGNYQYNGEESIPARLIGESKIMKSFATGIDDALESLNRFHDPSKSSEFLKNEFLAAKNNLIISNDLDVDLDILYDLLEPGTQEYQNSTLVHPILIVYETAHISKIEEKCITAEKAESMIAEYMSGEKASGRLKRIAEKLNAYPETKKVLLDFFVVPLKDVSLFRNAVYYEIHGVEYQS